MGCLWMVQTPVPTLAMATLGGMEITKALTRLKGLENDPVFMLLHGWGSNEYDLPDLLNYCGAGSADYASLQAPIAYGMGYTWFGSWAHEGVPEGKSLDEQALAAAQAIDAWVGANIPATRPIVMMGFSQGGLLATHILRFNPNRYAAAVSCSGWLAPGTLSAAMPDSVWLTRKPWPKHWSQRLPAGQPHESNRGGSRSMSCSA